MNKIASNEKIESELKALNGWVYDDNKLKKEVLFESYMESIDFITALAKRAEEIAHHPNLAVGYCKILVEFTSHDLGGVSDECLGMAKFINSITSN